MAGKNGSAQETHSARPKDQRQPRTLIIIGGHEDKEEDRTILREVARRVGSGRLVVTTVASHEPEGYFEDYNRVFREIGLTDVVELQINTRSEASLEEKVQILEGATGLFFTGGDQLKITSQLGDSLIFRRMMDIYHAGGVIAGTSAGASVMCETMLVRGTGRESHRIGDLQMAPGLGLVKDAIIDQHFAERGRMGRLLGAIAQNPRVLGIGIDEDTAIVIEQDQSFTVLGTGAIYIVDGSSTSQSNIADEERDKALSIYDVKLHVLSQGNQFDLRSRRPGELSRREAAQVQSQEAASAHKG